MENREEMRDIMYEVEYLRVLAGMNAKFYRRLSIFYFVAMLGLSVLLVVGDVNLTYVGFGIFVIAFVGTQQNPGAMAVLFEQEERLYQFCPAYPMSMDDFRAARKASSSVRLVTVRSLKEPAHICTGILLGRDVSNVRLNWFEWLVSFLAGYRLKLSNNKNYE
jgi:hypothetical protein